MKLIFSTALAVYAFDCDTRLLSRVSGTGQPEFYGISAGPLGMTYSNSCIENATLVSHGDYIPAPKGQVWITNPAYKEVTAPELLQPHQIECYENTILCANSGLNCITVFNPNGTIVRHYPTQARHDLLGNGDKANHFNSVHVRDGIVHVVAHNYERFSAVWLFQWPDFELIDVIGTAASWAHNVMRNGDDLLICNSKAGAVYSVNEKRDRWLIQGGGFLTRGLAATPDYLFVGLTALASRGDRKNCDSSICVLDRRTMRLLQRYDFRELGGIHEIRLLDSRDDCHSGAVIRSSWLDTMPVLPSPKRASVYASGESAARIAGS